MPTFESRPLLRVESPYPGLRTFEPEEAFLFFGREEHTRELLARLADNRFLAVVGTSGSGKSSLVRAGLVPALQRGFLDGATSRWKVAIMRPGSAPMANLAVALGGRDLLPGLNRSSFGILEAVKAAKPESGENLLLVVDQFEEVFRFQRDRREEDGGAEGQLFVASLLEAAAAFSPRVYVVLTTRSEFLGDCTQFPGLPEVLNRSQYLIPRLTREQCREAIEKPLLVAGATVAPSLVQRLLYELGDDSDQLPVLQHALNRTFQEWKDAGGSGDVLIEHYEAAGTLANSLNLHAEGLLPKDESGMLWVQRVFRCLTTVVGGREVRNPASLERILAVTGAADEAAQAQVRSVIDRYSEKKDSLLVLSPADDLKPETVVDISHESLIRQWSTLKGWVGLELDSVRWYGDVVEDAWRYPAKAQTWRDPKLAYAMGFVRDHWWNEAWAKWVLNEAKVPFVRVRDFLHRGEAEQVQEIRRRKLLRNGFVTALVLALVLMMAAAWSYRQTVLARTALDRSVESEHKARNDLSNFRKSLAENTKKQQELEAKLKVSSGPEETQKLNDALAKVNNQIASEEQLQRDAEAKLKTEADARKQLQDKVNANESGLAEALTKADDLDGRLSAANAELKVARADKEAATQKAANLDQDLTAARAENERLKGQLDARPGQKPDPPIQDPGVTAPPGGPNGAAQPPTPDRNNGSSDQGELKKAAERKSAGCISCHGETDSASMHTTGTVHLGCVDCHGGKGDVMAASAPFQQAKEQAHPRPLTKLFPKNSSANPVNAYADWLKEGREYIRFVNPGDLRVVDETCGSCHSKQVRAVRTSMMTNGAPFWGGVLYNNGLFSRKNPAFGESYGMDGGPQLPVYPKPSTEETRVKDWLPELFPLPGDTKRGSAPLNFPGFGALTSNNPVFEGLLSSRFLDPVLYYPGANDQPGDYRASGCTACHVIYANDRSTVHSGLYAQSGNQGFSSQIDPTIPKNEYGHPIKHELTRSIPSSQCVVCHAQPGASYAAQYYGVMGWDNETDGEHLYSTNGRSKILRDLTILNGSLKQTQFADFTEGGSVFRAVYKHDRKGNLLDAKNNIVAPDDKDKFEKAVHLEDIHLEKGMHCVDCHFENDSHGNGNLYGEPGAAVEIDCVDCHGTITQKASLRTSAAAAPKGGTDLSLLRTPDGKRRFYWENGRLYQRRTVPAVVAKDNSAAAGVAAGIAARKNPAATVEDNTPWEVVQTIDSITPGNPHYSEASHLAKTLLKDGTTWGPAEKDETKLAHANSRMTCYTCHTSWTASCFGCHLSGNSNGSVNSNGARTAYNSQVLRDDVFMLGVDSTAKGHRIVPVRSSSAVLVSSQNADRDQQQQTVSSAGYNGQAFSPHYPHTVRTTETRTCTDCHVSRGDGNNAWMAQLLLQGTNFVNFVGRYAWVGEGAQGFQAVAVTERAEPQAVIGSSLQKLAFPANYARLEKKDNNLKEAYGHSGTVLSLQLRGKYLFSAKGNDGVVVYDVSNIGGRLGEPLNVKTKDARWIAPPTTLAMDLLKGGVAENEEAPPALLYGFVYVADAQEGLVIIEANDPQHVERFVTSGSRQRTVVAFNPEGKLNGANFVVTAGTYAYISCDRGLVVVNIANPSSPRIVSEVPMKGAGHIAIQFRYAFLCDAEGLKIFDVTDMAHPVRKAAVPFAEARDVYVARTYAYVAAGRQGVGIVDVERPEHPGLPTFFDAGGALNDAYAVRIGMTNASVFAYVADGKNGLRVLQLISPDQTNRLWGFSPEPGPTLIATFKTKGPAIALSKGLDRDRAVDESGNQLAIFGRRGARPLNLKEMEQLYKIGGQVYTVTNKPPRPPIRSGR